MTPLEISKRPKAYYNIDGVGELGMGFMMLCGALISWIQSITASHSLWHQMAFWIGFPAMLATIHYGSKAIKEHVTYPRTGFVEYRKSGRIWTMLAAGVVAALVAAALVIARRHRWDMTVAVAFLGLLLAGGYAWGIARAVPWKWVVACLIAAGSLAIPFIPPDLMKALDKPSVSPELLVLFLLYGLLLFVSGAISLWLYLRRTQPPIREKA